MDCFRHPPKHPQEEPSARHLSSFGSLLELTIGAAQIRGSAARIDGVAFCGGSALCAGAERSLLHVRRTRWVWDDLLLFFSSRGIMIGPDRCFHCSCSGWDLFWKVLRDQSFF